MADCAAGRLRWWPQELRHPLFLGGAALYLLATMHKRGLGPLPYWPPILTFYLADVLALPLLLTVALWFMRRVYFRRPAFVLPLSWVISAWLAASGCFEGILPLFRPTTTADPLDVVAYAVGGVVFWRWLNQPA